MKCGKMIVGNFNRSFVKLHINSIVTDLYTCLPEFNKEISVIQKMYPFEGYTIEDLIKEYIDTYGSDQYLFVNITSMLTTEDICGNVDDLIKKVNGFRTSLFNSGFCNIVFNRRMARTYSSSDIFIYNNDKAKEFIKYNTGDVTSDKIINRVITEQ